MKPLKSNRVVKRTTMGDVVVSTVFLGLDHSFGEGPPVLWETMVFGGSLDGEQRRAISKNEAIEHHHEFVRALVS